MHGRVELKTSLVRFNNVPLRKQPIDNILIYFKKRHSKKEGKKEKRKERKRDEGSEGGRGGGMEGKVRGGATVVGFVHFAVFGMAVSLYFFRHRWLFSLLPKCLLF